MIDPNAPIQQEPEVVGPRRVEGEVPVTTQLKETVEEVKEELVSTRRSYENADDLTEENSSSGDMFRTVSVPLGTASTVGMTQPMSAAGPSNFAIFGMVGEAQFELVTTVPLGIGAMVFPPCPLLPFIPDLFTLTNNFGGSCAQVIGSTLTPWVSAPFPPVGFPVTLTFQGIIEESPGVYVPTNAVIYKAE